MSETTNGIEWKSVAEHGVPAIGPPVLVTYTGASGCACYGWTDSEVDGELFWNIVSPDDGTIWISDAADEDKVTHWARVPPNAHGKQW
jgi:hypothetical protein